MALGATLAACGGDDDSDKQEVGPVPPNAVARVQDAVIPKTEFNKWLGVAAKASQPPGGGAAPSVPDPPNFTKCIADLEKQQPKNPPKGTPKPTEAQLKQQCQQQYTALKDQVMQFLISAQWIDQEAAELGIEVSDADVKKEFEKQKKQSFPNEKDFEKFVQQSGMTTEDLLFRVKLDTLSNKIREKITADQAKVTPAEVKEYYEKNKKQFSQPERRDLEIILTKTEAEAEAAKKKVEGGDSWATVAKSDSTDEASKNNGGKLPGVTKGQLEKALDTAIFNAEKGTIVGPVKTQFGYYVFRVTKETPPTTQSLKQAEASIKQQLTSQNQQKSLDKFVNDFRAKWKELTNCAQGYIVQDCKNAPKQPTAAPGIPQQGAPPQGGAPQGGAPPQQGGAPPQGGATPPPSGQ